jgi:hypothetical protein
VTVVDAAALPVSSAEGALHEVARRSPHRAGPFLTILTGEVRARRAGRVRLQLDPTAPGARLRTKVVVSLLSRDRPLKVLMRSARL